MMKKMILFGAFLTLTIFVMNGFAQSDTMKSDSKMKSDKMTTGKNADSGFMMTLATGGANEIGLSQTALSKSSNDDVKQYAQTMVDDHTKAGDELKDLAMSKSVTLPTEMDAKHKAENDKLSAASGSALDMEYVKAMVKDHEKTVALLQKESTNGKDADAKAFAAKLLPTVQGHLDMAKAMMTKMMSSDKKMSSDKMKSGM